MPAGNQIGLPALIKASAQGLAIGGFFIFYLIHLLVIWKYAVNIPYADEWPMAFQSLHPEPFSLEWLVTPHNEHQILTTHLFVALQYYLNGWNHKTNLILNFLIYGATLAWLIMLARKIAPGMPGWILFAFTIFLLSPIDWMDHFIGLQVCFHFWLLFFLSATYFLFGSQTWLKMVIASLALVACLWSLAAGFVSGSILILIFAAFKLSRARSALGYVRKREILQLVLVTLLFGGGLALWYTSFQIAPHTKWTLPSGVDFWRFFLNLVSFGFGIDKISTNLGAVCLLIVLGPIVWQVYRQRGRLLTPQWAAYAAVGAILGVLAFVAIGRASLGTESAKVSRYSEIGMPLIVLSALNWNEALHPRKVAKAVALMFLWIFCVISFWDNRGFDTYRQLAAQQKAGVDCVQAYFEERGDGRCNQLAVPFRSYFLERARQLNVSFYREISARYREK